MFVTQRVASVKNAEQIIVLEEGRVVGMQLWYRSGSVAHYHLGAYTDEGYDVRASFGLFWRSIEYFADEGVAVLNLGGGAGLRADAADGLARFKRGWATRSAHSLLVGRILDLGEYTRLTGAGKQGTDFFPAYRSGEVG